MIDLKEKKEFIFPLNYKNKEKFLGVIDYKILITIAIFAFIMFSILKNTNMSLIVDVTIFIVVVGFFSIFLVVGVNGENMLDFLWYMVRYFIRERVYVYRKLSGEEGNKKCENLLEHIFQ